MTSKLLTAALLCMSFAACSESPITTFDRDKNCGDICQKYKDCVGGDSYDLDGCKNRCTDMKDSDETKSIEDCQSCVDDKSCVSSAFNCLTECAGIVP